MKEGDFKRTVYIKATVTDTIAALNKDLKQLRELSIKYVFIDEVTLISDFIDSAVILSDIYSAMGMKIVLSRTDSLGFWIDTAICSNIQHSLKCYQNGNHFRNLYELYEKKTYWCNKQNN